MNAIPIYHPMDPTPWYWQILRSLAIIVVGCVLFALWEHFKK